MQFKTLLQTIRPAFLILTPACIFLGASTAMAAGYSIDTTLLALVVTGALCAHISVNMLNEYADFRSGLDLITIKTPFSGGSGALPDNPAMAGTVLYTGLFTLAITSAIGIYIVNSQGLLILPIGIIGLVIILTYTQWINRWPLLCLIAPGLGFGILMVIGTDFVLTGDLSVTTWLAALVPFFLVNNLLLLNQFPDTEADRRIGRNHLPIAYGTRTSGHVYGISFLCAYSIIAIGIYYGYFPGLSAIALLPIFLSIFSITGAYRRAENIGDHPQYLGANVAATITTPLLLGISLLYA